MKYLWRKVNSFIQSYVFDTNFLKWQNGTDKPPILPFCSLPPTLSSRAVTLTSNSTSVICSPGIHSKLSFKILIVGCGMGGSLVVVRSYAPGCEPLVTDNLAMGLTIRSSHKQELSSVYQFIDVLYSLCIYEALRH